LSPARGPYDPTIDLLDTPLFLHPVLPALHLENPDVSELLMLFDFFQLAQK
jgi:hypothetical protein